MKSQKVNATAQRVRMKTTKSRGILWNKEQF